MKYKQQTIDLLRSENPVSVSGGGEYLERPKNGWRIYDDHFYGIGSQGNTPGYYSIEWHGPTGPNPITIFNGAIKDD